MNHQPNADNPTKERILDQARLLIIALMVAFVSFIILFLFGAASLFLVGGDGTAPAITHFTVWAMERFGHSKGGNPLVASSLVLGAVCGLVTFIFLELNLLFRRAA